MVLKFSSKLVEVTVVFIMVTLHLLTHVSNSVTNRAIHVVHLLVANNDINLLVDFDVQHIDTHHDLVSINVVVVFSWS